MVGQTAKPQDLGTLGSYRAVSQDQEIKPGVVRGPPRSIWVVPRRLGGSTAESRNRLRFVRGPLNLSRHWRRSVTTAQTEGDRNTIKIAPAWTCTHPPLTRQRVRSMARPVSLLPKRRERTYTFGPRRCERACMGATSGYPSTPLLVSRTEVERTNPVRPRRFAAGRKLPPSDGPHRPPFRGGRSDRPRARGIPPLSGVGGCQMFPSGILVFRLCV